ncbi:histidine kinase [Enterococcus florum]|uniref:histidine kinase n=1 Tax=Enterococcus florum TaxID=2480627 RepID=A0A4P5P8V0_9ENTE|nr:sensor histidine kinase [Enterococcus florum]GCF92651.1 histidine kinase [Enterococcus florum]
MLFKQEYASSIRKALHFSHKLMIALTVLPVVFISLFYLFSMRQYQSIIKNVNDANEIMSTAPTEINSALWYQVAGKPQEETPLSVIFSYEQQLDKLKETASTNEHRQTAIVAARILETVEHYAWEIDSNINNNLPIEENEKVLDEIYEVNDLLKETLGEYVTSEINRANQKSSRMSSVIILLVFLELILVCGLLFFIRQFQHFLDHAIQEPIQNFSQMTSQISQGNWQARVNHVHVKELDSLGEDLNKMANQIEILFDENTQKQKSLALSEIKVLQAQITPHFIYNTLDAILSLAQLGDNQRVQEATYALSNFFKITLNKGNEWTTVTQELKHVTSYLDILKIRYGPILSYEITIDPAIESELILKMILQPLVENALYHGIKQNRTRGLIEILGGRTDNDQLFFTVTDNGIGMNEEKLEEVKKNLAQLPLVNSSIDELKGYGLYNVYRRIKLYFAEDANLIIESQYKVGTSVTILLPEKREEKNGA